MICRRVAGMVLKTRIWRKMSRIEGRQKDVGGENGNWSWIQGYQQQQRLPMMFRSAFYFCLNSGVDKAGLIPLQSMQDAIKQDINSNYHSYTQIRQSLITHLALQHYNKNNATELIYVLSLLSQYPVFPLPKATLLLIYKIACFNLHLKSVQSLNNLLLFVLIADQQPSESPIFHQFIRFYLQLTLQEFKFKYQLDFTSMSPLQAIRQFIGKLVHRGFLPRNPPYQRNLNILYHEKTLNLLVKNQPVKSTQMIKKINYSVFLDIKQFYETQMKENLYHPKKKDLLSKFNSDYLRFLSEQVDMTHHETIHLRELYMKLYLTLPEEGELDRFKYKNAIFLYWLGMKHIQRLDHLKLEEIKEKIDVVIEYVQQVTENMKKLLQFTEKEFEQLYLSLEELILIVKCLLQAGITTESCATILNSIHKKTSPIIFCHYFSLFKDLFKQSSNHQAITSIISDFKNYQWLKLPQLLELLSCFEPSRKSQRSTILTHILTKILQTDFQVIGGQQIIIFLNIYQTFVDLNLNSDSQDNSAEQFRNFQMRYIADHHQQFSLKEFEEIVVLLAKLPRSQCSAFDDADSNYPNTIFEEVKPYFTKVSLLLGPQAKEAFQAVERQKSAAD